MKNIFGYSKTLLLSQDDLLSGQYAKLSKAFNVTKEDKENQYIPDLFVDCDHIKTHGEEGRGNTMFITYNMGNTTYIIGYYDFEEDEEEILNWWLFGAKEEIEIENTWSDWDKVKTGIAYRGGSGYAYGLTAKELK